MKRTRRLNRKLPTRPPLPWPPTRSRTAHLGESVGTGEPVEFDPAFHEPPLSDKELEELFGKEEK